MRWNEKMWVCVTKKGGTEVEFGKRKTRRTPNRELVRQLSETSAGVGRARDAREVTLGPEMMTADNTL